MLFEIHYKAPYARAERDGICAAVEEALLAGHFKPLLGEKCDVEAILERRMMRTDTADYCQGTRADMILTRVSTIPNRMCCIYLYTQPEMRAARAHMRDMAHTIDDDSDTVIVRSNPHAEYGHDLPASIESRTSDPNIQRMCADHRLTHGLAMASRIVRVNLNGVPLVSVLMIIGLNVEGKVDPSWATPMYAVASMMPVNNLNPDGLMRSRMCAYSHEPKAV